MSDSPAPFMGPPPVGPVYIREMEAKDLQQVVAIDRASFSLPWPANSYRFELFENPTSLLYVAETVPGEAVAGSDGATSGADVEPVIVGMIVIWIILDESHVATIAVHPDYRGQGIAQALLATALQTAIQRGVISATLEVRQNNLPAQKLYRRFQFEVVGRRPRYYHDNHEDALIMTVNGLDAAYLAWLEKGAWKDAPSEPLIGESV